MAHLYLHVYRLLSVTGFTNGRRQPLPRSHILSDWNQVYTRTLLTWSPAAFSLWLGFTIAGMTQRQVRFGLSIARCLWVWDIGSFNTDVTAPPGGWVKRFLIVGGFQFPQGFGCLWVGFGVLCGWGFKKTTLGGLRPWKK